MTEGFTTPADSEASGNRPGPSALGHRKLPTAPDPELAALGRASLSADQPPRNAPATGGTGPQAGLPDRPTCPCCGRPMWKMGDRWRPPHRSDAAAAKHRAAQARYAASENGAYRVARKSLREQIARTQRRIAEVEATIPRKGDGDLPQGG